MSMATSGHWLLRGASALSVCVVVAALAVDAGVRVFAPHGSWGVVQWWVLAVGVVAGLPHGAVDHLVPSLRRVLHGRVAPPSLVGPAYLGVAALAFAAFRAAPAWGLAVFVGASVLHFGTGETSFAALRESRPPLLDLPYALAHGSVTVLLPLLGDPAHVSPVVAAILGRASVAPSSAVRTGAAAAVLVGAGLVAVRALRRRQLVAAAELGVLALAMTVLPPLVAFGVYFGGWHALRHTARLLVEDPANELPLRAHRLAGPLRRLLREAALPTSLSLAVVVGLWSSATGWAAAAAAAIVVLASLSAPHFLIVALLDHADRRALPPGLGMRDAGEGCMMPTIVGSCTPLEPRGRNVA